MWHNIPHMLILCWPLLPVSQLVSSVFSHCYTSQVSLSPCCTWIWSGTRVAWSRCGWPCPWLVDVAGRRRGSPRRTSTGVYSSWSWPAGTQRCAPAPDPAQSVKQPNTVRDLEGVTVHICMKGCVCVIGYKPDRRPPPRPTWVDSF